MAKRSFTSRYRLLINTLLLALSLAALAVSPVAADVLPEGGGWTCETQCWAWEQGRGCTREAICCVNTDGRWFCVE